MKNIIMHLFVLGIMYWCISAIFGFSGAIDNIKYLFFLINISLEVIYLWEKNISLKFLKNIVSGISVIILFALLSWTCCVVTSQTGNFRTVVELLFLLIPMSLAFCLINIFDEGEILYLTKEIFIASLLLYIVERIVRGIDLSTIRELSFFSSYSPFESSIFADLSLVCFCIFSYFKRNKITEQRKGLNIWYYLSFFFVFLTFKRVLLVFATILLILDTLKVQNIKIKRTVFYIIPVAFFILTIIYTWLLQGENSKILYNTIGLNLDKFTVGRQWYLSLIENNGFISYGYGSTTVALSNILEKSKYLEMDLVKIYLEIGPIALGAFVAYYWSYVSKRLFSVVVMGFLLINMLFSHSLTTYYPWTLFMLLFYMEKQQNGEIKVLRINVFSTVKNKIKGLKQ